MLKMSKSLDLLLIAILIASTLITVFPAKAGVVKTITVPGDYSTLNAAISNAESGDKIIVMDSVSTYEEHILEINKSLTIIGENALVKLSPKYITTTILTQTFSSYEHPIKIQADDVTLIGFTFITDGGTLTASGNRVQITANKLVNFEAVQVAGNNCTISENDVSGGIQLKGDFGNISKNSLRYEMGLFGDYNLVSDNEGNQVLISKGSNNKFFRNCIVQTDDPYNFTGQVQITGQNNFIVNNTMNIQQFSFSTIGSQKQNIKSENNSIYNNNLFNNLSSSGVSISTEGFVNFWDNGKEGNYWDDYTGNDGNGDGIGDVPYVIDANNVDCYPLMKPWTGILPEGEPSDSLILPLAVTAALAISFGLAFYFKKRKH